MSWQIANPHRAQAGEWGFLPNLLGLETRSPIPVTPLSTVLSIQQIITNLGSQFLSPVKFKDYLPQAKLFQIE